MSVFLNQFPSGEWQKNFIPFEEDASQRSWLMPYLFVHGKKPGHKITIIAAIHGDELNGVRICKEETVREMARETGNTWFDRRLMMPMRYSQGFMLGNSPLGLYGPDT